MELHNISWPVFKLRDEQPQKEGGAVLYTFEYLAGDTLVTNTKLVDDTNAPGDTLGARRLCLSMEHDLFKTGSAIYFLQDLVKLAKPTSWFIDSKGNVFKYKKTISAKLKIYKVKQVLPAPGIGCVLELEGLSTRYKSLARPTDLQRYAGVLHWGMSTMLYGLYTETHKETWRKI